MLLVTCGTACTALPADRWCEFSVDSVRRFACLLSRKGVPSLPVYLASLRSQAVHATARMSRMTMPAALSLTRKGNTPIL